MAHLPHRVLLLTVAYGQGHNSAATALAEEFKSRGWETSIADPCAQTSAVIFPLTRLFYRFCVRRAPWLWGIAYAQTETADWAHAVPQWPLSEITRQIETLLREQGPDVVICTYPLYAYMLDVLHRCGNFYGRYAVVVTDSLEISRPWMLSQAPLVFVPDEYSEQLVRNTYALSPDALRCCGFPVKRGFAVAEEVEGPSAEHLNIIYGAYRSTHGVRQDIDALLSSFPQLRLTVLAGSRADKLAAVFSDAVSGGRLKVLPSTSRMADLMHHAHFYIGKAGAATMFECYASQLPMLVNFALPGQERGNLELLLRDRAGCAVSSTADLISTIRLLMADGAHGRHMLRSNMKRADRADGAPRIADEIERRWCS